MNIGDRVRIVSLYQPRMQLPVPAIGVIVAIDAERDRFPFDVELEAVPPFVSRVVACSPDEISLAGERG